MLRPSGVPWSRDRAAARDPVLISPRWLRRLLAVGARRRRDGLRDDQLRRLLPDPTDRSRRVADAAVALDGRPGSDRDRGRSRLAAPGCRRAAVERLARPRDRRQHAESVLLGWRRPLPVRGRDRGLRDREASHRLAVRALHLLLRLWDQNLSLVAERL